MPPSRASAIARRASVTVSIAAETTGMFSAIVGVSRVTVETSFGRTCDSAGSEEDVVEREPFLAELPLERDEALDLLLAKLGLHGATLAASGDGDQSTSMPSSASRSRARAAPVTSPFAS